LQSLEHAEQVIAEANGEGKLVILDFTAYNCPPCKIIAPLYEELSESEEFENLVVFLKINVDDNPLVAQKYNVDGWPTFLVIKHGVVIDSIVGGNAAALGLYAMVTRHATS
jgi:thioredoxin 1